MSQILINHSQIFADIINLRRGLETEVFEMRQAYSQCRQALQTMDGRGNFRIREALEANMEKAVTTTETLDKLLLFIDSATREAQQLDQIMARIIDTSQTAGSMRRGGQ